ncbi:sugar transferase [Bradyrhizobium denitrificans]|nr:sugar transferase [Bradyrhizobium denitrificans]MCL8485494.1 sugar transferase [Bradyrhizobium denitrificans]
MNSLSDTRSDLRYSAVVGSLSPVGVLPKRIVDIVLALGGIILLAPLLVICYVAVVLSSPGPALFRHKRVGFTDASSSA